MAFVVVLDACVLYPFSLRDTLLRFAEAEAFAVRWSDRILEEVRSDLVKNQAMTRSQAALLGQLERAGVPRFVTSLRDVRSGESRDEVGGRAGG